MIRIYFLCAGILIAGLAGAQDTLSRTVVPKIFGPNKISSGFFELNASFLPGSKTVFFTAATNNWDILAIFSSSMEKDGWSNPVLLPFSGKYRDADPYVSHDGKKLYFISDRPVGPAVYKDFSYRIYYVTLDNGKITSEPVLVNLPLPEGMSALYPSVAANGNLYFTASVAGKSDLYVCEWKQDHYTEPKMLSFNTPEFNDIDPMVAFDESFIIFSCGNRKGVGGSDLYISKRINDQWSEPVNLGAAVNTKGHEMAPGLSRDNKKLYFTAYREKFDRQAINEMSTEKLKAILQSYQNGSGNIYEVDISTIVQPKGY